MCRRWLVTAASASAIAAVLCCANLELLTAKVIAYERANTDILLYTSSCSSSIEATWRELGRRTERARARESRRGLTGKWPCLLSVHCEALALAIALTHTHMPSIEGLKQWESVCSGSNTHWIQLAHVLIVLRSSTSWPGQVSVLERCCNCAAAAAAPSSSPSTGLV